MPITQDRIATLLEEHENCLRIARDAAQTIERALTSGLEDRELATAVCLMTHQLRNLPDKWAIVERERINVRWKRNVRLRSKAERKRRTAGINAMPEKASISTKPPVAQEEFDEAEYERFNRGETS